MFDFGMGDQLKDLNTIAAWFLGSGVVLLVIGLAWAGLRWGGGKLFASSGHSERGLTGVALALVGALLLGSIGGAIQWSSTKKKTEMVMPEAARQKTITVNRPAIRTTCTGEVGIAYDKFMKYKRNWLNPKDSDQVKPADDQHKKLEQIVTQMGIWKWKAKYAYSKSLTWGWAGKEVKPEEWQNFSNLANDKDRQDRLAKVTWVPDGRGQDCTENNLQPAPKTKLTVIAWENDKAKLSGDDNGIYVAWEFEVPDNAKTKKDTGEKKPKK